MPHPDDSTQDLVDDHNGGWRARADHVIEGSDGVINIIESRNLVGKLGLEMRKEPEIWSKREIEKEGRSCKEARDRIPRSSIR